MSHEAKLEAPQAAPTRETVFDVGAITAGTPVDRSFSLVFRDARYPWRTLIRVDNTRGTDALKVIVNGQTRRVATGAVYTFTEREVGRIYAYSIDALSNIAANLVYVYEDGGISRSD